MTGFSVRLRQVRIAGAGGSCESAAHESSSYAGKYSIAAKWVRIRLASDFDSIGSDTAQCAARIAPNAGYVKSELPAGQPV
jgi:hypothetical protein